ARRAELESEFSLPLAGEGQGEGCSNRACLNTPHPPAPPATSPALRERPRSLLVRRCGFRCLVPEGDRSRLQALENRRLLRRGQLAVLDRLVEQRRQVGDELGAELVLRDGRVVRRGHLREAHALGE